ncbi:MAG: Molybdopterin molybdenumtransferase [Pelotomaculum sp. PtaB.Bin104]|nr:MAG: Molybdopterin molybdenumtransferase [Pelotomaculum sp. PtaB.Bin104]
MKKMIPLEEAQQILLECVHPLETVELELLQAQGMVLAGDIVAPRPLPPFARSPLDGFAFRAADTAGASGESQARLYITETIYTGRVAQGKVEPGTAARIATGAPVPEGADSVVPCEAACQEGQYVLIDKPFTPGENVIPAGEDVAGGEIALPAGQALSPPAVALLAAIGYAKAPVHRRPRVAIFSTGDELVPLGQPLPTGKIYISNPYAIAAQVAEAGGEAVLLESAVDEEEPVTRQFARGLELADLVISTGGASVGERDVVKKAMKNAGAEPLFWKVACKPGTPVTGALREGRLLIGMPGNPAAAMIMFSLLVRPLLRLMSGQRELHLTRVNARLAEDFSGSGKKRRFVPAVVQWQEEYSVRPVRAKSTGAMTPLVESNALIDIPAAYGPLQAGDLVEVVLL